MMTHRGSATKALSAMRGACFASSTPHFEARSELPLLDTLDCCQRPPLLLSSALRQPEEPLPLPSSQQRSPQRAHSYQRL